MFGGTLLINNGDGRLEIKGNENAGFPVICVLIFKFFSIDFCQVE
jgi:hypothetical protein